MPRPLTARTYRPTARNLAFLAKRLGAGELVAVPTETVYGLAANALDEQACRAIFRAKGRPLADPLIVHLHTVAQLELVAKPNAAALQLAHRFWPGPLTLVLPKQAVVPGVVSAGRATVAVRVPAHPVFRQLLKRCGLPLAAPSANPFGYISPTTAQHVQQGLEKKIRYILDGGPAHIGLESTIVDLRDPARPRVLRPGPITTEMLAETLGRPVATLPRRATAPRTERAQLAPGLLARHYSPRTPVTLHRRIKGERVREEAYVFFRRPAGAQPRNVFWLDAGGDLRGAARRLFALLRQLDARKFRRLHVELAPGAGLALAINDRLRRAASR